MQHRAREPDRRVIELQRAIAVWRDKDERPRISVRGRGVHDEHVGVARRIGRCDRRRQKSPTIAVGNKCNRHLALQSHRCTSARQFFAPARVEELKSAGVVAKRRVACLREKRHVRCLVQRRACARLCKRCASTLEVLRTRTLKLVGRQFFPRTIREARCFWADRGEPRVFRLFGAFFARRAKSCGVSLCCRKLCIRRTLATRPVGQTPHDSLTVGQRLRDRDNIGRSLGVLLSTCSRRACLQHDRRGRDPKVFPPDQSRRALDAVFRPRLDA